jgi:tetratricopeptide (TPR) repeat protein
MKTISAIILVIFTTVFANAQVGITTPRTPSPAASVSQTIGISTVTINYSRPSVNNRKVWGELVPYGWNVQNFGLQNSAPWRAGANENTVIHFSDPATVQGKQVPAGDYGLFFVINEDNTGEVILSKEHNSWGSFFYDKKYDVLRSPIKIKDAPMTERLTYEFNDISKTKAELDLVWEKKAFPVSIEFAVDDLVIANAERQLKSTTGFSFLGPMSAANYALNNNVSLDKALVWANQAVNQNANFQTLSVKSNVQKALGNAGGADSSMKAALAIANEGQLNAYGYNLLNQKKYDEAIDIFILVTQRFPRSANAFDSLGEGYAIKGDKKNAITNFKKALSMNPPEAVKANSEKYLKQLEAK